MPTKLMPLLFNGTELAISTLKKLRQDTQIREAKLATVNISHIENGDVIKVDRGIYDHYGIFVSNGKHVIHYTGADRHSDFNGTVRETTFSEFLSHSQTLFICRFSKNPEELFISTKLDLYPKGLLSEIWEELKSSRLKNYHLYSGDETVKRAKSKIGAKGYNILFNNCEHFAVWCKTGIRGSSQVDKVIDTFLGIINSKAQKIIKQD